MIFGSFLGTEVLRKSFSTPSLNSILGFIETSKPAQPNQLPTCQEDQTCPTKLTLYFSGRQYLLTKTKFLPTRKTRHAQPIQHPTCQGDSTCQTNLSREITNHTNLVATSQEDQTSPNQTLNTPSRKTRPVQENLIYQTKSNFHLS